MLFTLDGSAFPISGRQYDAAVTQAELHAIRAVYAVWLPRWGVATPRQGKESASTMLQIIFGTGGGFKLRPEEWRLLTAVDRAVVGRVKI